MGMSGGKGMGAAGPGGAAAAVQRRVASAFGVQMARSS
ncbi:hypothetical protein STENM223S_04992 [Streptomyces tendae]